MRRTWSNWDMSQASDGIERLKELFEKSITQSGRVRIYTVLNHVSSSGMTRYISAYVPVIQYEEYYDDKNKVQRMPKQADIVCIAREKKIEGCGMDMGFDLAYRMYHKVYEYGEKDREYQDYLSHSWL